MNGNDVPNIVDVRDIVRECAGRYLTTVTARAIADLVADRIETMDCLELLDGSVTWERVDDCVSVASVRATEATRFDRCGHWAA